MNTSFGQALKKYINTISQKKAINTHMLEKSGVLQCPPFADIERPVTPKGRTRFLTDEAVRLQESSRKDRTYRFYYYLPGEIDKIRKASNGNFALGTSRFADEISKMLDRRVSPGKAGRPK